MGKYSTHSRQAPPPRRREIHPIWRGIGFAMILLIPFLSFVAALIVLEQNGQYGWFPIPADLLVNWRDPMILIKIILTLAIAFILYAVFMLVTFFLYRVFAPPRYGPMDAPPVSYRGKKRSR